MPIQDIAANPISDEIFAQVAEAVGKANDSSATTAQKVRLYGLYKRATVGRLTPPYDEDDDDSTTVARPTSRPGMFQAQARAKYDAWKTAEEEISSKQEAKMAYVTLAAEAVLGEEGVQAIIHSAKD